MLQTFLFEKLGSSSQMIPLFFEGEKMILERVSAGSSVRLSRHPVLHELFSHSRSLVELINLLAEEIISSSGFT